MYSPHRSTEDDFYDGYFIPKGTVVIPNVWELNHDPEVYGPDANDFNPARYLNDQGQLTSGPLGMKDDGHFSFGRSLNTHLFRCTLISYYRIRSSVSAPPFQNFKL